MSTSVRILIHPLSPEHAFGSDPVGHLVVEAEGEVRGGGCAREVRGDRHLEEGREGLRPGPGRRGPSNVVDGDDVGIDDQPGPGVAGSFGPEQVSVVVMEATSDYWRPFYYLLEADFQVMLVNAREAKNVPGRKSDVSDAAWLADLGAHGLLRASFVPPEPIRQLRDLTRARSVITRERTREVQRLEKLLEDSGIKLSSVASDITGVSGRLMLQALIDTGGAIDPAGVADLAKRRLRSKIGDLTEALTGHFSEHHAFMARLFLDRIDSHSRDIAALSARVEELMEPFLPIRVLLESIPGCSQIVAEIFIAETGGDMRQFPTAGHLASWTGVSPGSNESAGRVKSTKTRPGNRYLKGALGVAALTAARCKNTFLSAKYRRIASSRGPMKAVVAVEHAIIVAAWNMLSGGEFYRDPGADFYTRRDPGRAQARAVKQLEALGFHVTIVPVSAAE